MSNNPVHSMKSPLLAATTLGILTAGLLAGVSCELSTSTAATAKAAGSVNPGDLAGAAASCPDTSSVAAIAKADWGKVFGIDAKVGAQVQGGVMAALELKSFAKKLDADLKVACGGLARDLDASGDWNSGGDACKAAATAMADIKAKFNAGAKISLDYEPPHCSASMDAMAKCVGECDANLDPGSVDVQCEPGKLAGKCSAQCQGSCELEGAAKCGGTCEGSCQAKFKGTCGGKCTGKCDGKAIDGAKCAGKCKGSCSARAEGTCGGKCEGSCKLDAAAKCNGTCRGECTAQMEAPRCEGEIEPPKASAECNASCQARVQASVQCTKPRLAVRVKGAGKPKLAAKYKAAITKNMPAILNVAVGMKDQALSVAGSVETVVGGVQGAIKSLKADAAAGARLTACVAAPFKAAIDAAASVQANVSVSVNVSASASGSASASAG